MSSIEPSYAACLQTAKSVARDAGQVIASAFQQNLSVTGSKQLETKTNFADLVTATDKAVEAKAFAALRSAYPDHAFIGEESASAIGSDTVTLTDNCTWVLDPIDGTTNFVHGFPMVAISIALFHHREPVVGVIYNPILDEMYAALKGGGAELNGTALPLRPPVDAKPLTLATSLVGTEFGSDRRPECLDKKTAGMARIGRLVRGVRCIGSCALALCLVARGTLDAFWESGVHIWDFGAGVLIVREAGGYAHNYHASAPSPSDQQKSDTAGKTSAMDWMARNVLAVRSSALAGDSEQLAITIRDAFGVLLIERE